MHTRKYKKNRKYTTKKIRKYKTKKSKGGMLGAVVNRQAVSLKAPVPPAVSLKLQVIKIL